MFTNYLLGSSLDTHTLQTQGGIGIITRYIFKFYVRTRWQNNNNDFKKLITLPI